MFRIQIRKRETITGTDFHGVDLEVVQKRQEREILPCD